MRIGLMIGSEKSLPYPERFTAYVTSARAAEQAGFASMWIPQVPGYFDAMTMIALMGDATERIEIGTSVIPFQSRHPVALTQQALTAQAACDGRFTLGVGPSHHWIVEDQWGLPYEKPAHLTRNYLQALNAGLQGPGSIDVENDQFTIHSPIDVTDITPTPVLLAALAPVMLRIAGEHTAGTILWMADQKAISDHVIPRITKAADEAGRAAPRIVAAVPVTLCADAEIQEARDTTPKVLGSADISPNYQRLLSMGDSKDLGDVLCAGSEEAIAAKIRTFRDAGVTDFAARPVPIGDTPDAQRASRQRTVDFLSTLTPEL